MSTAQQGTGNLVSFSICEASPKSKAVGQILNNVSMSFPEFIEKELTTPLLGPKDGRYFVRGPAKTTGLRRSDESLAHAELVILDGDSTLNIETGEVIDGCPEPQLIHTILSGMGINHVVYTSHSHGKNGMNKCRVVLPCYIADKHTLRATVDNIIDWLRKCSVNLSSPTENYRWSQPWYFPRLRSKDTEYLLFSLTNGHNLDSVRPDPFRNHRFRVGGERRKARTGDESPIGQYNTLHGNPESMLKILENNGYALQQHPTSESATNYRLLAPGSKTQSAGCSLFLTKFGKWKVYSHHGEHCLISADGANEAGRACDAFDLFRIFEHGGDSHSALEAIGAYDQVTLSDFVAYMPAHQYLYIPTRDLWPAASVDARLNWPQDSGGKSIKPSKWLDKNAAVEQMTWAPGRPMQIKDKLIDTGGWIDQPGCTCFNQYRPPTLEHGDAGQVGPWVEHVHKVYLNDASHIILWLAHRVQRPQEKINHALVLGGKPGIGKDTLLESVKQAVGPWNCQEGSPSAMLGRFNGYVKSVILRVSEARDLGSVDRWAFYEHMKPIIAAPPDVIPVDEKHLREYPVPNVCGVVITTNYKTSGLYLPEDDRRHYVAWSDLDDNPFEESYWTKLWQWYQQGGFSHVAAYLAQLDISGFNPKAPPTKTEAFWHMVNANRAPEDADLAGVLDLLQWPDAITLDDIKKCAGADENFRDFSFWLADRKNRRVTPHRFETAGYEPVRNPGPKDGLWKLNGKRQAIYAKTSLAVRNQILVAQERVRQGLKK